MRKIGLLLGVLALAGCHSQTAPEDHGATLAGLTLPLNADGRLKLEVAGRVGNTDAEIALEVSEPETLIADGCFPSGAPSPERNVRVPKLSGGFAAHPEITVRDVALGNTRLGPIRAGLISRVKACRVTLGSDVLDAYALAVDLSRRTVTFRPPGSSRSVAADPARETARLDLSRDPQTDWLVLPIRIVQSNAQLTGPFAIETDATRSHVSLRAATDARLQAPSDWIDSLRLPMKIPLPAGLLGGVVETDQVELSPSLALNGLDVWLSPDWKRELPLGTLGSDAWGRFDAVIDPAAHALVVSRPRRVGQGEASRCGAPGQERSEACFELQTEKLATGARAIVSVWRDMKHGGRVEIEPLGADHKVIETSCRLGFTFAPQPEGASLAQSFPWPEAAREFPGCAPALAKATSFRFSAWSPGFDRTCPGSCAFIQDALDHQTVCACEASVEQQFESVRPFLDHLRDLIDRGVIQPVQPTEKEPDEP